jgi:hypothetical protein
MIEVTKIRRDGGTQSRAGMNGPVVYEYADLMKEGVELPAVVVFHDGQDYWLADGFHRVAAADELKHRFINADVRQGTQRDAVLYSVGANSAHGLRRTNDDKRRAVTTLLQDKEWVVWSDGEIAKRCGVSQPFVGKVRREVAGHNGYGLNVQRQGADGKTYTVKHWGLSNGMAFWQQVAKFHLDKEAVLKQLQPGATLLTDLNMSKEDCWRRLDQIAQERTAALFPVGSIVKHTTGRFGEVMQAHAISMRMMDFRVDAENTWHMDDCKLSSLEAYEASLPSDMTLDELKKEMASQQEATPTGPEEFYEGDIVTTPTGHEGTVTGATGRLVTVQTINGNRDYNRAFLTLVRRAEAAEETTPEDESPDLADDQHDYLQIAECFTRIFEYSDGQTDATPELLQDVRALREWLWDLEGELESEVGEIKVSGLSEEADYA